ncbi:MAG: Hpt domain-containing protein [Methylacidiphilales bacterium]|nr:Hpt domain-containing protein [Candidatus Methylacidiphilales bacterium]
MSAEPAFDWVQAASLLGDDPQQVPDDMAEIVRELVDGATQQFQELKAKNAGTDRKEISSLAHQLRGCLLNFGFTEVGAILLHIEGSGYATNEYPGLVDDAAEVFVASKKLLANRYPTLNLS